MSETVNKSTRRKNISDSKSSFFFFFRKFVFLKHDVSALPDGVIC